MTDTNASRQPGRQIVIDVAGVEAETPITDLTVGQLVQLLAQVIAQIPVKTRAPDAAELRVTLQQVRDTLERTGDDNESVILKTVRDTQDAILRRLPEFADEASRATAESGPGE
ncbi:hypothetical protein [Actinomadura opuntiae]|uniref:hypothetical protein n=1 Tax=Actinomadura sp. OS1-43 TaxID=604315 RepID=UPI00255AA841|nr:hypothetical protein [Actinomadura sp. OS1-43]MDL4819289.1 hypothetical protein [Actinomadura sp. OS1-43]